MLNKILSKTLNKILSIKSIKGMPARPQPMSANLSVAPKKGGYEWKAGRRATVNVTIKHKGDEMGNFDYNGTYSL